MNGFESQPKVAIIGAGRVGSTLAQRLAEKNIADVVLLDIVPGLPQGIALDLMEARGLERHDRQITGTNAYEDLQGVDVIVITAGKARTPGMSRDDLLLTNARIVGDAARQAAQQSPQAIFIKVSPSAIPGQNPKNPQVLYPIALIFPPIKPTQIQQLYAILADRTTND